MRALPGGLLAYLAAVVGLTLAVVATTAVTSSVTGRDWAWLGLLLACAIAHLEVTQGLERIRELPEGVPYTHLQSTWYIAGLLLLPLPLQVVLIGVTFAYEWVRVFARRAPVHRKVFSASTVVLGATLVLTELYPGITGPYVTVLDGPRGVVAIVLAGLIYRLTNYGLVIMDNRDHQHGNSRADFIRDRWATRASRMNLHASATTLAPRYPDIAVLAAMIASPRWKTAAGHRRQGPNDARPDITLTLHSHAPQLPPRP